MTETLTVDDKDESRRLDDMVQGVLSAGLDRPEGPLKVAGQARYAHEYRLDDVCHGVLVRAPVARGRITGMNADAVTAMPGVLAVVTDERFLQRACQGMANAAPVQGATEVQYFGQCVAVVVAETFEQARHGAQALKLEIEAASDPAVSPDAVEPEQGKHTSQGDLEAAMASAAASVDLTYTTPAHNSAAMEPHTSIASWEGERLTLRGAYQMLKYNVNELADSLGIDPANVRILSPYVGGGFGSKLGISPEAVAAAIASKQLGRPVSVMMTRQQVFEATMRRSETTQRIRLACDGDGRLTAVGHEATISNLPEEAFAEPVTQATPFLYRGENRLIGHRVARLHRTTAGSVRAPGEAVGIPTLENAMDELAEKIGMDPVEFRKINIPEENPTTGKPFSSHMLAEALDRGAEAFGWSKRNPKPAQRREGEWWIGMGMASAVRVNIFMESETRVTLQSDGTALVETDMTDIGTGTYAILTQLAGEMLGLPVDKVTTILGDSDLPTAAGSGGSWGAASSGTATYLACLDVRKRLAERLGCDETELTLKDGQATHGNTQTSLAELAGDGITGHGHCKSGEAHDKTTQASWGAYFAEVAVNAVTGETRVRRMTGAFAAGRILNAKTARSQCLGGITWGIGMALHESLEHDPRDGHIVNRDLAEYHVPVNLDVPQIEVLLLDDRDDWANPIQAKGIGELGICGAGAAVTNAIYNACGVRVYDYPATLDKILPGLPDPG